MQSRYMPDLSKRNRLPEWMDQPDISPKLHQQALVGLSRLNYFSNSTGILWKPLSELARHSKQSNNISVLDIAAGSGDIPLALAQRAKKSGINIRFTVTDKSAFALKLVDEKVRRLNLPVECIQADALDDQPFPVHDVVICSLFLHHLDNDDAIKLIRRMAKASRVAILLNDLERSWLNWHMVWLASRLLTRSPVVHMDGPLSVSGAYTKAEAMEIAIQAGLENMEIKTCWPCRFLLSWKRQ